MTQPLCTYTAATRTLFLVRNDSTTVHFRQVLPEHSTWPNHFNASTYSCYQNTLLYVNASPLFLVRNGSTAVHFNASTYSCFRDSVLGKKIVSTTVHFNVGNYSC
jgi:hypothetical protein